MTFIDLANDHDLDLPAKCCKADRTLAFNTIKVRIGCCFVTALPTPGKVATVLDEIAKNLEPLRRGRQQPRPHHEKPHNHVAIKPNS